MANIKFSDFTVGNTEGDVDFVVGYKGANNIQISPTNLLASALGNYLPLAGGTMTGDLRLNDSVRLRLGTSSKTSIYNDGTDTYIQQTSGDLYLWQSADDKDIIFASDNGSGGVATYFLLDGSVSSGGDLFTRFPDNSRAVFGTGSDLQIYHSGASSSIRNQTGDLYIQNLANDSDIIFQSDDGSGGVTNYIQIDGSELRTTFNKTIRLNDSVQAQFGGSADLQIYHDSSNSHMINFTGNLRIRQFADGSDITFESDDGSGGTTEYFRLDGGDVETVFSKRAKFIDNARLNIGSSRDLVLFHNGTDSFIINETGNLKITQGANDADIIFECDDGSGGVTTYFYLDGGRSDGSNVATRFPDGSIILLGSGTGWNDGSQIYHNGTNSYWNEYVGNIEISCNTTDGDIIFKSDDGSGGLAEYFRLDGGNTNMVASKTIIFNDGVKASFGNSEDLKILHSGTGSAIINENGNLDIQQRKDDADIIFSCDDGSGGTGVYFLLDGSLADGTNVFTKFVDNSWITMGNGGDLLIGHQATSSKIENYTGPLYIVNKADDQDIIFQSDDGSGGTTTYFYVDGGNEAVRFSKDSWHNDNVKALFGTGTDLEIYHDGSHSYIEDAGTGDLRIKTDSAIAFLGNANEDMIVAVNNGAVSLYYDNSKKLETTSAGVRITGVSEYADNTAALAGGLTTGDVYRTGDLLKIVH